MIPHSLPVHIGARRPLSGPQSFGSIDWDIQPLTATDHFQICANAWLVNQTAKRLDIEEMDSNRELTLAKFRPKTNPAYIESQVLRLFHSYREPAYRGIQPSISARHLPATPAELRFQSHQFDHITCVRVNPHNYELEDFENLQRMHAEIGQRDVNSEDARMMTKAKLELKREMNDAQFQSIELEAAEFVGVPHLEISSEPILLRHGLPVLVSVPPPNKYGYPAQKCVHGIWKCRNGEAYSCSACHKQPTPFQTNWRDRLRIEESQTTCALCGQALPRWQNEYCTACWKTVIWTLTKKTPFTSEFFTEGASAKYQKKRVHKTKRGPIPTWEECMLYLRKTIVDRWWSIGPNCDPGDLLTMPWMDRYFRDIPWVKTFVTRWWMVTHGFKIHEIEGGEGVQLDHYFARDAAKIRAVVAKGGNSVKPKECAMSS
jgi:hypothetical protein